MLNLELSIFEILEKQADLKGNMAKRIMFSLLSHLVPAGQTSQIPLTNGMIDLKALKAMIPGAKELIKYGTTACLHEILAEPGASLKVTKIDKHNYFDKANKQFQGGNVIEALNTIIECFTTQEWETNYGGKTWAQIAEAIKNVAKSLKQAEGFKKNREWELEAKSLMEMVAYMNVLDGLAHNTGSIMDKMVSLEEAEINPDSDAINHREYETINRVKTLMDAKELSDPDEVLQEILPDLEQTDALLTMKDWMHAARRKKHEYSGDHNLRSEKLELISLKKDLQRIVASHDLFDLRKKLTQISNMPDNKINDYINSLNKYTYGYVYIYDSIRRLVKKYPEYLQIIDDINPEGLEFFGQPRFSSKTEVPSNILKSFVWNVVESIDNIEKVIQMIGERV